MSQMKETCRICGAELPPEGRFCGECGFEILRRAGTTPEQQAASGLFGGPLVWLWRLAGLAVIAAIGFGIWYYYSGGFGGGSSYASRAVDIVNAATDDTDELLDAADADFSACEASNIAACDRGIDHMSDLANRLDKERRELNHLDPPAEAESWHRDYFQLLSDESSLCNRMVRAYRANDWEAFSSLDVEEFDDLDAREAQLRDYFNKHLR